MLSLKHGNLTRPSSHSTEERGWDLGPQVLPHLGGHLLGSGEFIQELDSITNEDGFSQTM